MKFEEALKEMRDGKKVTRGKGNSSLSIVSIICYDGNTDRASISLNQDDIIADDWEVTNG